MKINDTLKLATIALANFAASGALGTAAATVDVASSFVITQTTASISLTLPNPTDAVAGDRLNIGNSTTSTQSITVAGVTIEVGIAAEFVWSGTAWLKGDGGRNDGGAVTAATIPVGNSIITHNLNLPVGTVSNVVFQAFDASNSPVMFKRNTTADTANAFGISSPVAIATATKFYITPLA